MGETYQSAGVSLDAADETVALIKGHARSTFRPEVLSDIGGFGGLFALGKYNHPVLVSSTDGVGTKMLVAHALGRFETIGLDLVAMCADDIVVQGAEPLFFLDYVGVSSLNPVVVESVVAGIAAGCRIAGCALIGGEVAEHPGGDPEHIEVAGFVVGVVERDRLISGAAIVSGDVLIGLHSPGLRSNGYSLARKVLLPGLDGAAWPGGPTIGEELLRPSVIYSRSVLSLIDAVEVHGLAHITGGGIPGNLGRVLPSTVDARMTRGSWPVPRIFDEIQRRGDVAADEMERVFNLGVGMIAVVPANQASIARDALAANGIDSFVIGAVVAGRGAVSIN